MPNGLGVVVMVRMGWKGSGNLSKAMERKVK